MKTTHRGGLSPDKYLSDDQLKKLRQYVKDRADLARQRGSSRAIIDELIIELLANTGLRASELCDLNIEDLPMTHGKPCVFVRDGKGGVSRAVEIPDGLAKRLERFVRLYRKKAGPKQPLIAGCTDRPIHYRTLYEKIRRLGSRAGIENLHPHTLRHTYLTRLFNTEQDIRFCQDQAGHRSLDTTAIYAKTNNAARRRQVEALDQLTS